MKPMTMVHFFPINDTALQAGWQIPSDTLLYPFLPIQSSLQNVSPCPFF